MKHDLTPEQREALAQRGRETLPEITQRPEVKVKYSLSTLRRFAAGEQFGFRQPGVHGKIMDSKVRNGTVIPTGGGRGICGWRRGLSHYCRSTLEANFARILLLEGVPYDHEPKLFRLLSGGHYTPDFKLYRPLGDTGVPSGWVELKGWREKDGTLPKAAAEKVQAFEALGEQVFVLTMHDDLWGQIEALYAHRIELWETPTRNLRSHPEMFGVDEGSGSLGPVFDLFGS